MSGAISFLAVTGALAWLYAIWRTIHFVRDTTHRLRWALWGFRKVQRRRAP
jgi:hypothetical protein